MKTVVIDDVLYIPHRPDCMHRDRFDKVVKLTLEECIILSDFVLGNGNLPGATREELAGLREYGLITDFGVGVVYEECGKKESMLGSYILTPLGHRVASELFFTEYLDV